MADEPLTDAEEAPASPALADVQRERDDYQDRWLRKSAEFDNYRKRVERERREQGEQAVNDLLRKYGVRPFEAVGADFDPNLHQAVVHEESSEHRDGEVIGELRKGYMIGDRLLRPA